MVDKAKLFSLIIQHLKCWLCNAWLGIVVEKNWAIGPFLLTNTGCRHCILVYLIDFLSILLRCNGFTRIQKVVVD